MALEKIENIIFDKIKSLINEKIDEIKKAGQLKDALVRSISDCNNLYEDREIVCVVDGKVLDEIDKLINMGKLQPNFTLEKLQCELAPVFICCIIEDDNDRKDGIEKLICENFRRYTDECVTHRQVDDDIHMVNRNISNLCENVEKGNSKILEHIKLSDKTYIRDISYMNNRYDSNVYWFLIYNIEVYYADGDPDMEDVGNILNNYGFENVFMESAEEGTVRYMIINFDEPKHQSELEQILKAMNDYFINNNYGVLSITTNA